MPDPETVVRSFFAAWPRRNMEEVLGYFTDDALYHNMPLEPARGRRPRRRSVWWRHPPVLRARRKRPVGRPRGRRCRADGYESWAKQHHM